MKSRYIKRRKKFHYIIISVTIIVCLLGTVFTSLAILDSSRDLLIANAVNELNTKMDYIKNGIVTSPNNSYNEYVALINENVDKGNTYFQLTYDNDMTITTDNVLTVHYNDINGGIWIWVQKIILGLMYLKICSAMMSIKKFVIILTHLPTKTETIIF